MTPHETRDVLHRLAAPLRGLSGLSWCATALGLTTFILGAAAWVALLGWFDPPYWVLVAWLITLAVIAVATRLAWRKRRELSDSAVAFAIEDAEGRRSGTLVGLLEPPASGTSGDLLAAADRVESEALRRSGGEALAGVRARLIRRAASAMGLAALGLITLVTAGPFQGQASALWRPGEAWAAMRAPVRLVASATTVDRGDSVDLFVEAVGRAWATLWTRAPGESWQPQPVELDSTGRARLSIGPLVTDVYAIATTAQRSSDTVAVQVRLPAFLGSLDLMARYPRYLGLPDEPLPVTGDTILLPVGTRIDVRGTATTELAEVNWSAGESRYPMNTGGTTFDGRFVPQRSAVYRLEVATASGASLGGDDVEIPIRLVPDQSPVVLLPVPGRDTLAPLSLRLPLVIDARDDYGLRDVRVRGMRLTQAGLSDSIPSQQVSLPDATPEQLILTYDFDLNSLGLLPGDSVRYVVEATDNAPRPHFGRSKEYVVRLPTMSEVRAAARAASEAVAGRLDSLALESREVERRTEDLSRERQRSDPQGGGQRDRALSFEDAERAEAAAQAQRDLMAEAQALQEALETLQRSVQDAGINDPAWQSRVAEIRDQLDRALTPELRERLDQLQQALQELDAERTQEALQRLAEAQKELREALERSRELFRRAALEGDLANLGDEARELANQQEQWNRSVPFADSAVAAAQEDALRARADSLAAALERLAKDLAPEGQEDPLEALSQQARSAAAQMQNAEQSAAQGNRASAQQQGDMALQQLQPLGDQLQQQRMDLQAQWREEVVAALDRSLAETSRLLERQLTVEKGARAGHSADRQRADQGAVEEGVETLIEQLQELAGRNALISPQIAEALASAKRQMELSREAVSTANPNQREATDRAGQAADALNAAAYQMLRSRGDVSGSGSGSGLTEAMERMSQLAQQQGQLSQQGGSLLPMVGQSGVQQELRRLGAEQRRLAEQLERLQAEGQTPAAAPLAQEARELARRLEAGRLDRETVQRQERLFRRLLDQGRTLQGQEEDEEKDRQSRAAEDAEIRLPPALRAQLQGSDDRIRLPTWEALQRLSPEERRLVIDYFRRLADQPAP